MRKDPTIHDKVADRRWSCGVHGVCTLRILVPGRPARFDRQIDRHSREVLELGCARGFKVEVLASRAAQVTGIDAARAHRACGVCMRSDVGVGEAVHDDAASPCALVCADVPEQVADVNSVLSRTDSTLRHAGLILFKILNHTPRASLATITIAEDYPRPVACPGPLRINRRVDLTFGPRPGAAIPCPEVARTPLDAEAPA